MTIVTTRRRFLAIAAATGAAAAMPLAARGATVWRGRALGADAEMTILGAGDLLAREAIAGVLAEVERLERVFSLHRPDSELARLNRDGRIDAASLDLRRVIAASQHLGRLTAGAFDITVQPLWDLHAQHFSKAGAEPLGPSDEAVRAALSHVDHRAIEIDGATVRFLRPGMAATLNGIAQGYITDRVAALLVERGLPHALIDMGEIASPAAPPGEAGWAVGIADPRRPGHAVTRVTLGPRQAMATSSGPGTRFDAAGRHHHIFDPATGRSAHPLLSITVLARHATLADALSTALAVRGLRDALPLLRAGGASAAIALDRDGRIRRVEA